ncbi:membrane protein [Spirochaetia bacterium]|nr:membrane protein [Spirochaetia bacterium]
MPRVIYKRRVCTFLFLAVCFSLSAQGKVISIDEYCTMALEGNSGVKSARYAQTAANAQSWQAFTNFFPKVSGTGGVLALNLFGGKASIDLDRILGTNITMNFDDKLSGTMLGLTVSQVIFAGGRIFSTNILAQKGKEASAYQLVMKQNEAGLTARQKYFQYVLLKQGIEVLNVYSETLDALYNQASQALERGAISRTDTLRVEVKREEINIQKAEMEDLFVLSGKDLKLFAGLNENAELNVVEDFDVLGAITEPSLDYADISFRLSLRPEYKLLNIQAEAAKLNEIIALGEYAPSIEAGITMFRSDFYNGYWTPSKAFYQDAAGFIVFNLPISKWWEGYHKYDQMRALTQDAVQKREDGNKYLLLDMENKFIAYKKAWRNVHLAELGVKLAQANLSAYKDGYRAGINSMSDYLEALGLVYENTTKLNQSKSDYWLARTAFEQSSGQ